MEINTIFTLKKYWGKNGIVSVNTEKDINKILATQNLALPYDFIFFFKHLNGTYDQDEEGFHFYKVENLTDMRRRFDLSINDSLNSIVIFADYMLECWSYGVKMNKEGEYEIGIISSSVNFKKISSSFDEFVQLYLMDSPILYEYE
jgi:hypothetical protein